MTSFLREVAAESSRNQMDTHNLSIIFAPTLLRSPTPDYSDPGRVFSEVRHCQMVIKFLLDIPPPDRIVGVCTLLDPPGENISDSSAAAAPEDSLSVQAIEATLGGKMRDRVSVTGSRKK